mmetsp:Transcript_23347/g.61085  ORF Transcript_23347/g.61085 Transcript_23347/m.61085 type:complete len:210 (-) Transcript_23347:180-809(-)
MHLCLQSKPSDFRPLKSVQSGLCASGIGCASVLYDAKRPETVRLKATLSFCQRAKFFYQTPKHSKCKRPAEVRHQKPRQRAIFGVTLVALTRDACIALYSFVLHRAILVMADTSPLLLIRLNGLGSTALEGPSIRSIGGCCGWNHCYHALAGHVRVSDIGAGLGTVAVVFDYLARFTFWRCRGNDRRDSVRTARCSMCSGGPGRSTNLP